MDFNPRALRALTITLAATFAVACDAPDTVVGPTSGPVRFDETMVVPGTMPPDVGPTRVLLGSLVPVVTVSGRVSLSVDGVGTNAASGLVEVLKPAGATVRSAFVAAASTGGSGRVLANGDVSIDGQPITWSISTPSSITSFNHWADVTSLVQAKINAAPPGLVSFTMTEVNTFGIDGEVLAVIFDDPAQTAERTVSLLFGAQDIAGDDFYVNLANPVNTADPTLVLDMALGIGFGYQPAGQYSVVDVNGVPLSSCAGGQDDGADENGALLTVGGIGDLNTNPAANCTDASFRNDDELYDLRPFVPNGASQIHVFTRNPSTDDNIFFAAFYLSVRGSVTTDPDPDPPTCTMTASGTDALGRRYVEVTTQDTKSGLFEVLVTSIVNATYTISGFTPATTDPVIVRATKINNSSGSTLALRVTDGASNVTECDPVDVTVARDPGTPQTTRLTGIPAAERWVDVNNQASGLTNLRVVVNGKAFEVAGLADDTMRRIDIGSAMKPGNANVVELIPLGKPGGSAWVLVHD